MLQRKSFSGRKFELWSLLQWSNIQLIDSRDVIRTVLQYIHHDIFAHTHQVIYFTMPRCEAKKKDGKRCTKTVGQGVHFCPVHQNQNEVEEIHEVEAFEEALEEIMSDITAEAVALDVSLPFPNPLFESPNEDDSTTVTDGLKAQNLELQGLLTSQQNELTVLLNKYNDQSINLETLQMENAKLLDCIKTLKKENLLLLDAQQQKANTEDIDAPDSTSGLLAEIETLKEKVKMLEQENNSLMATTKPKKGKRQPKDIQYLAKFVYYHKLKTDAKLVQEVKEKLVKADVSLKKTVKGKEQDVIPWMIVKQITDELYAGLDPAAKKVVLDETKAKYNLE
jgi:hypothetical protein